MARRFRRYWCFRWGRRWCLTWSWGRGWLLVPSIVDRIDGVPICLGVSNQVVDHLLLIVY